METRGRKKFVGEPTPPACNPRDVETIKRLQQRIQELELQQLRPDSPAEEVKTEPNVWDEESVDVNPFGGGNPRYVNRLYQPHLNDHVVDRDDPIRSLGLKIEIPEFTGKVHTDDFIDWVSTVERVFDVRDIPDKLKVKLVAIKLQKHASLWWDHVNKRRRIEGTSKVETWEKMKKLMKDKFLPENHRQEAFLDYHNLSQQNMIVEEVINEFDKLPMKKTKHDGFQNTYSFKKDGVNITLVPFDSRQTQAEGSNLFMKKTDFDGEHCIDFIPGSVIPNRLAYRMNPKEFAKLHRQVIELLEKGLIRESTSSCAVPALLVPKHGGTFRMCIDSRAVNKITVKSVI
ncbi:reverse transcriptase domain-containing protein [Tanacetum coccineum]